MKIIYTKGNFDVSATIECGQVFRYNKLSENSYQLFSLDKYAVVTQVGNDVEITSDHCDYFYNYFDLDTDYARLNNELIEAGLPIEACSYASGIRILRQDPFETTMSFIISANNNISRIKKIIEAICHSIGSKTEHGYAFPTANEWASCDISVFTQAGAGYRAPYLHNTALTLLDNGVANFNGVTADEARKQLVQLSGVGPKVADCILLFGYHFGNVVPVDTWIKRVYHNYYEQGHRDKDIATFFVEKWRDNAGLAQQYLFYFERKDRQN